MGIVALICDLLAQDLHGDPLPAGAEARLGTLRFRAPHFIGAVAVSADGSVVAAFEHGGGVLVWDGATGRLRHRLRPRRGKDASPSKDGPGLALTPDGRRVAAGSYDDQVRVWETDGAREIFALAFDGSQVSTLALSPDGRRLAAAAGVAPLLLVDLESKRSTPAPGPSAVIRGAAFSPDGKTLAIGGDKEIVLVDPAKGAAVRRLPVDGYAGPLAYSFDGRRLAYFIGLDTLRIEDTAAWGEPVSVKASYGPAPSLQFDPDGKKVLFSDAFGVSSYDLAGGVKTAATPDDVFHGRFAVARTSGILFEAHGHGLRVWKEGREQEGPAGHRANVAAVAFSPDGRRVLSAAGPELFLWNTADGRLLRKLPSPDVDLRAVAFSPDGRRFAAGGVNYRLTVWDVESGDRAWTVATGPGGSLASLAFSPDGARLAVGDAGGKGRVYDAASGAPLFDLRGHTEGIRALACLDARTIVSASGDHTVRLWSARNGRPLGVLEGHTSDLSALAVSPDGARIVSASIHMNRKRDGTIRVWESFSGALLRTIDPAPAYPARSLALAPDGRTLAAFSLFQDEIKLWDLRTGRAAGALPGHANGGDALAFALDGRLASGGMDTAVLVWKVPAAPAMAAAPPADLEKAWADLLSASGEALEELQDAWVAAGAKAVDFLLARCRPVPVPEAEKPRVEEWVRRLASEDAALKAEAVENLKQAPWTIEPFLTGEAVFLETRELQALIRDYRDPSPPRMAGAPLRRRRAILILERIGGPEAKAALKELAALYPAAADALSRLR